MKKFLGLALALCSLSGIASATTITFGPVTTGLLQTNWGLPGTLNPVVELALPKFDPSLGTLNSVKLTLVGVLQGNISVTNQSSTASMRVRSFGFEAAMDLMRPDGSSIVVVLPGWDSGATVGSPITVAPGDTLASGFQQDVKVEAATLTSGADKALFTGIGNIMLKASAESFFNLVTSGGTPVSFSLQNALADVYVEYDYTEGTVIPEPATSALAGAALLLIGFVGRRFRN